MSESLQNDLHKSIIYSLSLCSLENFHTCFLNWLGNNYPTEFTKIFTGKEYSKELIKVDTQVRCGTNIIDLQIKIEDGNNTKFVVIENKLKSYATEGQLNEYKDFFKNQNTTFILLSLAPKPVLPSGWRYMRYGELALEMSGAFKYNSDYDKNVIEDYINVISKISEAFPLQNTYKYDFYEETELNKYELEDIYIKYRTSELKDYLRNTFSNTYKDWKFECSFHHKKGTIDIYKEFKQPYLRIGMQIEGNQYRYYLIVLSNDSSDKAHKIREKIAMELAKNLYWFVGADVPKRHTSYSEFCGYNPDFIYRYFLLNKKDKRDIYKYVSYDQICDFVRSDIVRLEHYQKNIINIVEDNIS